MTTTMTAPKHTDLSRQYDCAATMTVVTFECHGMLHRARRFWRSDMPTSGAIEIYVLEPYAGAAYTTTTEQGWYDSAFCEDFLRYADRKSSALLDEMAISLIGIVREHYAGLAPSALAADQSARFAAIELF